MIRSLTDADYNELIKLWKSAGLDHKPLGRDSRESLSRQLSLCPDSLWGYFQDNELIASIMITDDGRKGWINRLAVHPDFRHQGIAGEFIRFAESLLRKKGLAIFAALIETDNVPSITRFQKCGYTVHEDIVYLTRRLEKDV